MPCSCLACVRGGLECTDGLEFPGRQQAGQGPYVRLPAIAVQPPICTSQMKKKVTGENQIAISFSFAKMVTKGGDT